MARVASMFVLLFTVEILLVNLMLTDVLNHVWFTIVTFYIPFSLGVLLDTGGTNFVQTGRVTYHSDYNHLSPEFGILPIFRCGSYDYFKEHSWIYK